MAGALSEFMTAYSQHLVQPKSTADPYASRKQRRNAVSAMAAALEEITFAEERYRDNIPENLQGSRRYDDAELSISSAYEAITNVVNLA